LESINVPNVKISGLNETINKMMLETFFELEENKGGGKIKNIDMDSNEKCATLTFKEKAGNVLLSFNCKLYQHTGNFYLLFLRKYLYLYIEKEICRFIFQLSE
jgi:hypothetical protein